MNRREEVLGAPLFTHAIEAGGGEVQLVGIDSGRQTDLMREAIIVTAHGKRLLAAMDGETVNVEETDVWILSPGETVSLIVELTSALGQVRHERKRKTDGN